MPGSICIAGCPEASRRPSHNSIARPAIPFSKAAVRASCTGAPGAYTVAPAPLFAARRSRIATTSGRTEPARITPMVSSSTRFACSRTETGISSHWVCAAKRASVSIGWPMVLAAFANESGSDPYRPRCSDTKRSRRPEAQQCGSFRRGQVAFGSEEVYHLLEHRSSDVAVDHDHGTLARIWIGNQSALEPGVDPILANDRADPPHGSRDRACVHL